MSISPSKTTGTVPQRLSLPSNPTAQDKEEWSLEKGLLNHGTTNSFSVTSVCLLTHLYTNLYTTNKDSQMHHKKPHRAPSQGRRQPMTKQGQEPRPEHRQCPLGNAFGPSLWWPQFRAVDTLPFPPRKSLVHQEMVLIGC